MGNDFYPQKNRELDPDNYYALYMEYMYLDPDYCDECLVKEI